MERVRGDRLRLKFFSAAIAVLLVAGCRDWRKQVRPGLAVKDPVQTTVQALPTPKTFGDTAVNLTARAKYKITAWVVATDDNFDDGYEDVVPRDVSLAWGPLGNPDVLASMRFHLARRYVSVRWDGDLPLEPKMVMRHLSNHHLIPSTPELAQYLGHVKEGDLLELEGYLVDIEKKQMPVMRTSLSREDVGNGACEIVFVERAEIKLR